MDLRQYTIPQLRVMIKEIKSASMGIKDMIMVQLLKEEIERRKFR